MRNLRIPQVFTLIPNVVQVYKIKIATTCYPDNCDFISYSKRDLNPHSRNGQGILSPSCLPIPPFEQPFKEERKTRLELATLTLARLCSTN